MNWLLVNGMYWKPVYYSLPATDCTVLIEVTESQLRPLEHWLPGVGMRMLDRHIMPTHAIHFELGFAKDKPGNVIARYTAIVDESSQEWEEFCNAGPYKDDIPGVRKLPLRLKLLWAQHGEDLCS